MEYFNYFIGGKGMKKIIMGLVLSLLVSSVFALDLGKVEEVWDKSMDITATQLDNLDFDIPKAEDVEAKVDNEMRITELESKTIQLEAEIRLLEKEKDELEKRNKELELYILELEYIKRQYDSLRYKSLYE